MAKVSTQVQPFQNSREQLMAALAYIDLCVKWAVAQARAMGLIRKMSFVVFTFLMNRLTRC